MGRLLKKLEGNRIPTLIIIGWTIWLVSWVTLRVFGENPPDIPAGTAGTYATLFGLPALAIGLWKWNRPQPHNRRKSDVAASDSGDTE